MSVIGWKLFITVFVSNGPAASGDLISVTLRISLAVSGYLY